MAKLKIGIITHNFPGSVDERKNAGIFIYDLVRELSLSQEIVVFAQGSVSKTEKTKNLTLCFFGWNKGARLGSLNLLNPSDLFKLISFFYSGVRNLRKFSENGVNVNLAMWAFPSGLLAYVLKKWKKTKYGIWALGSDIYVYAKLPVIGFIINRILCDADFLIADGIDLKKEVEKISNKKCLFIPSATKFEVNLRKHKKTERSEKCVLTFLGRLEKVKGPDLLIKALILIKDQAPDLQVNIIGEGSLEKALKNMVIDNTLQSIRFFGNINDSQKIYELLNNSDWVIIPSRSDSIPLVFSESMRARTPVIVSSLPDLKYLVRKYRVGLFFEKNNPQNLAKIILKITKKRNEYNKYRRNTLTASKIFSIEQSAKKLRKVISYV